MSTRGRTGEHAHERGRGERNPKRIVAESISSLDEEDLLMRLFEPASGTRGAYLSRYKGDGIKDSISCQLCEVSCGHGATKDPVAYC
jgi:hypothetical protein